MPSSRSLRKRQSRLTFTPLPSSSPATKTYHKQIQDRAAAVGYDGSPSPMKRRKVQTVVNDEDEDEDEDEEAQIDGVTERIALPTPQPTADGTESVHSVGNESEVDSEPVRSTQKRVSIRDRLGNKSRAKQGRLYITSHTETSAPLSSSVNLSSPVPPSSSRGIFGRAKQRGVVRLSSDESGQDEDLPELKEIMKQRKTPRQGRRKDEGNGSGINGTARVTRSSQKPVATEDQEDEEVAASTQPASDQLDGQADTGDESDLPVTQGKMRRGARKAAKKDAFIDDDSLPELSESDDDVEILDPPRAYRKKRQEEAEDEDEEPVTPGRRKLKRSRQLSRQEQEDLDEDLDFLKPSSDEDEPIRKPRSTQSAQKNARQQALERLKQKRSGSTQIEPVREEPEDESKDQYSNDSRDEEQEEDITHRQGYQPPTSSKAMFEEDEFDEGFLEEEGQENFLGVPSGIPLAFTRYASMKAKELFRFAVDWMVQKKINPAFRMNDEIYELTFKKLDDEVRGLAGSKFTSAAWTPEFTRALYARPEIAYDAIDRSVGSEHYLRDKCDACNRTSHPATFQMQFQGQPYNGITLDDVQDYDDDGDESDPSDSTGQDSKDDKPAYDAEGREVAPANKIYYIGKFCKANAETAHALQHWKYHLNAWVLTWLARNGYEKKEEIVKRDRLSSKKRRKYANKVVDRMEDEGVVKQLWGEFKNNVDAARNSKQGRFEVASP